MTVTSLFNASVSNFGNAALRTGVVVHLANSKGDSASAQRAGGNYAAIMHGVFKSLNLVQGVALQEECMSVSNLLRDAVQQIRELREPTLHQDAVFALASIGAERLLKLSVGGHALDADGSWPSTQQMMKFGHNINALQARALEIITERGIRTTYVQGLVDFLTSSPTLTALLDSLSHYGLGARFYHLNALADGKRSEYLSPREQWTQIENTAIKEFPEMGDAINKDLEQGLILVTERISQLFDQWWFALHRILISEGFGPHGKEIGSLILPVGKKDPFKENRH